MGGHFIPEGLTHLGWCEVSRLERREVAWFEAIQTAERAIFLAILISAQNPHVSTKRKHKTHSLAPQKTKVKLLPLG